MVNIIQIILEQIKNGHITVGRNQYTLDEINLGIEYQSDLESDSELPEREGNNQSHFIAAEIYAAIRFDEVNIEETLKNPNFQKWFRQAYNQRFIINNNFIGTSSQAH